MEDEAGPSSASGNQSNDPRKIARKYQLELCKRAVQENIIVYLETGCGKTHIAVLLIYELGHLIRKPQKNVCVFLAPTVHLVRQQSVVIEHSTDFKVGSYVGSGDRPKNHNDWEKEVKEHEVLVMTPQIFLRNLEHCFIRMEEVALLIFDECHHAQSQNRHPYGLIMKDFYTTSGGKLPRIFGMTASPIMGKSRSKQVSYSKCINSLEELLDAKVCTVSDREELDSLVASPNMRIYTYDPVLKSGSFSNLAINEKLEEVKDQCISMAKYNTDDPEELQEKMKLLWRLHENVQFCSENLGLWGGAQAVQILLNDSKSQQHATEGKGKANDSSIRELYLTQAASAFNLLFTNDGTGPISFHLEALEEPFFSQKLLLLIRILSTYRQQEGMKCIIFVKRIIAARALAFIIGNLESLHLWKCEFLVGFHTKLKNLSRKKMNSIVENFRSGKLNLLVATNVAEEGLDIQTCCLVIRFDIPETLTSFIQSRGRARMQQSEYVFLVERENQHVLSLIKDFASSECRINEEIKCRTSSEKLDNLEDRRYGVNKTGASISAVSSVSLLHHYCAKLPRDEFFTPKLSIFYLDDLGGTVCRIVLPPNAAFRQMDGPPCFSKDEAKRNACLRTCIELHKLGCLTDYLLPTEDEESKTLAGNITPPVELEDECSRSELCEMLVPSVLRVPWSDSENFVSLNFYIVKLVPIPDDRSYQTFGLFLLSPLPKESERMRVNLFLTQSRMVEVELVPSGIIRFDREEITHAQNFQEMWLKVILDRQVLLSDSVSLGTRESFQIEGSTFYLLLPVRLDEKHDKIIIDWAIIRAYLSSPLYKHTYDGAEKDSYRGMRTLKFANGYFDVRDIPNSLVVTPHNNRVFCVIDILHDVNGYSNLQSSSTTEPYVEYFRKQRIDLSHPEQPLLKAKQLFNLKNLLQNRHQKDTTSHGIAEHFVELPPELCSLKILSFSKELASTLSLLPSIMHRLENFLVAIELKGLLSDSFPEGSRIPATRILEALTTERCFESFSLERLEVLGDAFLKYVVGRHVFLSQECLDEGKLTQKRSSIVNNLHLYELAVKNNLQVFIRDRWFDPTQYYALGRPCTIKCDKDKELSLHFHETSGQLKDGDLCSKCHHWLHRKTIADVVEALLGAYIVDSGFIAAISFLRWIGIPVDFQVSRVHKVYTESKRNLSLIERIDINNLENLLGYKFQFKGLLLQAFTHPSYEKHPGGCYQRLEFLGDAVLDYLITSYLFSVFPNLTPGQMTDLRSIAVSNNSFAQLAVSRSFQSYLISDSKSLSKTIDEFVKFVHLPEKEQDLLEEPKCPKVLGDLIESCTAAILLDSGLNLQCVWTVMLPFLYPAISFSCVQLNPFRELQELCQSANFILKFEKTRTDVGEFSARAEVSIDGICFSGHANNSRKKTAERKASQDLLTKLKARGYKHRVRSLAEVIQSARKEKPKLIGYDETPIDRGPIDSLISKEMHDAEKEELTGTSEKICTAQSENPMHMTQCNDGNESVYNIRSQLITGSAKSRLYEICAANSWNPPSFVCCGETGPCHSKLFIYKVVVQIEEITTTILECFSEPRAKKKAAEEHAAEGALWYLRHKGF